MLNEIRNINLSSLVYQYWYISLYRLTDAKEKTSKCSFILPLCHIVCFKICNNSVTTNTLDHSYTILCNWDFILFILYLIVNSRFIGDEDYKQVWACQKCHLESCLRCDLQFQIVVKNTFTCLAANGKGYEWSDWSRRNKLSAGLNSREATGKTIQGMRVQRLPRDASAGTWGNHQ